MRPHKKGSSEFPKINDRVSGAEQSARELSERVEAFLAELARPPEPPPWSPPADTLPDSQQMQELDRMRNRLHASQRDAIRADRRAEMVEQQLTALQAFCRRLERVARKSEERLRQALARADAAESALAEVTSEMLRLHGAAANDRAPDIVEQRPRKRSGANDSPREKQARVHLDDLLYPESRKNSDLR